MSTFTFVDFEQAMLDGGRAERTAAEYAKWVRRLLRWRHDHGQTLGTITAAELREWAEATVIDSWASRKQARTAVHHWLVWLGLPADELVKGIRVPPKPVMRSRALEVEETRRLRDTAVMVGGTKGLATLCGLYLAARAGEMAALTWKGYDDGWFSFARSKTRDTLRLPVHPILAKALDAHRAAGSGSLYVFPGNNGRPYVRTATIWSWITAVGEVADVKVTPHRLRHTALTVALENTKDLRVVMDLAGHRDPTVTAGYTRVTQQRLTDAVMGLEY